MACTEGRRKMNTITKNTLYTVLFLAGTLGFSLPAAAANKSAGHQESAPALTNIIVNPVSIPNIPLRIRDAELVDIGEGAFALKYSISNEGLAAASLVRLMLVRYDAMGNPKGGENWTSREYVKAGETRNLQSHLKATFNSGDRVAVSILNAQVGNSFFASDIASIVNAVKSGATTADPASFTPLDPKNEDGIARCASAGPPVASVSGLAMPQSITPTPLCNGDTFCESCSKQAKDTCAPRLVDHVDCDATRCTCSYVCK